MKWNLELMENYFTPLKIEEIKKKTFEHKWWEDTR